MRMAAEYHGPYAVHMSRRWLLGLALVVSGCRTAEGGGDETPTANDTGVVTMDATAEAATDASSDVAVDAAETAADVSADMAIDTSPRVCPTSSTPKDCSPGTGTGEGDQCHDAPSCWVSLVQKAVNAQISAHPDWFDTSGSCPLILKLDSFLDGVVADLAAQGYCVKRDPNAPNEEITMKRDNAFTENFDIVASTGCARSGTAIYTGYCAPAWW